MPRTPGAKDKQKRLATTLVSRINMALISEGGKRMEEILDYDDFAHFQRLRFLNRLYLQHHPQLDDSEICRMYRREYNLSYATFTKDRNYMQQIFGPRLIDDLTYIKGLEYQRLIKDRSLCYAAGDWKSAAMITKLIHELLGLKDIKINEGENSGSTVITNIQINYANGESKELKIDLEKLQFLQPDELAELAEALDHHHTSPDDMKKLLESSKFNTDAAE